MPRPPAPVDGHPRPLPFTPRSERLVELFHRWCREELPRHCRECRSQREPVNSVGLCNPCTLLALHEDHRAARSAGLRLVGDPGKYMIGTRLVPLWARVIMSAQTLPPRFKLTELVIDLWRRWPDAFGLHGLEDQHPDSNKVCAMMSAKKGPVRCGWIRRVEPGVYELTEAGKRWRE